MAVNHKQLRRLHEAARRDKQPNRFFEDIKEGLDTGELKAHDFSIRQLFENFVEGGREIVDSWNPRSGGDGVMLYESAVKTSDFSNITGQIVYSAIMEAWETPGFIGDQLMRTIPTPYNGEKIAGISGIGDEAEAIGEGQPYPTAGVSEDWIETPETTKRGLIVPVTKEATFFDRTGVILERCRQVAEWLRVNKEKRQLDTALGITDSYKRKGRDAVASYGDNAGDHDWDNLAASNGLVDWTDIETAELLFDGMTDPNTGEPIMPMANSVVVPTALVHTARRILNATEIEHVDNQANASTIRTRSANPIQAYTLLSNQYVKARTTSATTWFLGDFQRAFAYMENWPITSVQAPSNSHDEFHRDIINQFKASERGVPAVIEPRYVVKSTQ